MSLLNNERNSVLFNQTKKIFTFSIQIFKTNPPLQHRLIIINIVGAMN